MENRPAGRAALKYDARGRVIQNKKKSGLPHFLLFWFLPYLVINAIILLLVIAKPEITAAEPDTKDYNLCTVSFSVKSLLPVKTITANIQGQEVALQKDGNSYTASVEQNGNLAVTAKALNGMQSTLYIPINLLDDTAPSIDQSSVYMQNGILEFDVTDTQSGVDFDSIYGIDADGDNIKPTDINREKGHITFSLKADAIDVYVSDLSGNQTPISFTLE